MIDRRSRCSEGTPALLDLSSSSDEPGFVPQFAAATLPFVTTDVTELGTATAAVWLRDQQVARTSTSEYSTHVMWLQPVCSSTTRRQL